MYCTKCGAEIGDARFCPNCGAPAQNDLPAQPAQPVQPVQPAAGEKKKKPVFKRWWFWAIIILLALVIFIAKCGGKSRKPYPEPDQPLSGITDEPYQDHTEEPDLTEEIISEEPAATPAEEHTDEPTDAPTEVPATPAPTEHSEGAIRPEFQKAMDDYLAFYEKYCAFMKKYKESGYSADMLTEYMDFLQQSVEFSESFSALGDEEMSEAELLLYIETTNKVEKMLLEIA